MFERVGRVATRRAKVVVVLAGLLLVLAAALGAGAVSHLKGGGFTDPRAQSETVKTRAAAFGGQANLVLLVDAARGTVDSPAVAAAGADLTRRLTTRPGITSVISYWSTKAPSLRGAGGREGLILLSVAGDDKVSADRAKAVIDDVTTASGSGPVTVRAGGELAVGNDITNQVGKDLAIAEGIAIPVTLILLVLVFGSVIAALLPVAVGVVAIVGTLAVLRLLAGVTDVSIYALNLTTALGLGLGIDYALLIVNRYREELGRGLEPRDAVVRTVATAGRTVVFSAATVAAALSALAVFPLYFLRSFAYAGIAVVGVAMVAALVLLPALLMVLGRRVGAGRRLRSSAAAGNESHLWRRVANTVMRRPVLAALPVIALLVALGTPFLHVNFGTPDDRVLPASAQSRQVGDALRAQFPSDDAAAVQVVTNGALTAPQAAAYSAQLSRTPSVERVDGPAGTWVGGVRTVAPDPASARFARPGEMLFSVIPGVDPLSHAAQNLVRAVRAAPAPGGTLALAGGQTASLVDQKHSLAAGLPLALGLVAATTFILLFLFTGSVVLPVKALVLNVLSLSAVFGAIVWIFQDGHLSGVLGFTATPTNLTIPPLMFCVAFGLSMDYEVFLVSRIKELHDGGLPNTEAIAGGLARTGRIVSTAALLLAVTFFAFGLSKVSFIQLFGIGTGIAVVIDATLVRGVLVPAFMRLAGDANWWAPAPLRRLHARIGLGETGPGDDGGIVGVPGPGAGQPSAAQPSKV